MSCTVHPELERRVRLAYERHEVERVRDATRRNFCGWDLDILRVELQLPQVVRHAAHILWEHLEGVADERQLCERRELVHLLGELPQLVLREPELQVLVFSSVFVLLY